MEKKQEKAINEIEHVLGKLEKTLVKLGTLELSDKDHKVLKDFYLEKAYHDVKKILKEVGKFEKYDDGEFETYIAEVEEKYPEVTEIITNID